MDELTREILRELNLVLAECRAHMAKRADDEVALKHLGRAVRKIERARDLLKPANGLKLSNVRLGRISAEQ